MKSLGKAGVTQGSFLGSYVYINTDSNGFQEFLGPQDAYLFHHETHMFWAVRYIIVMRQMRCFTTSNLIKGRILHFLALTLISVIYR